MQKEKLQQSKAKQHTAVSTTEYLNFREEITTRIRSAQYEALKAVNKELIALYWMIGKRISEQQTALGWGKAVVATLSQDILKEFPAIQGFSTRNIWNMVLFYREYQHDKFMQPLVAQISWSKHIIILTKCKETQQRHFYLLATKKYGWTKEVLIHKIELKTYEKYLLGQNNFELTIPEKIKAQSILAVKIPFSPLHFTSETDGATLNVGTKIPPILEFNITTG